ncbi:hypothetical protein ABZP36_010325 [Zizania latifolia]
MKRKHDAAALHKKYTYRVLVLKESEGFRCSRSGGGGGKPATANFSSHIQELRGLIAASSSTSALASVHFEVKLREVLPNLLRDYVVPSSLSDGRGATALLKLLSPLQSYTAGKFPGFFFHGRAADVIRVIGRILPFFADPQENLCSGSI